MKPPLLTKAGIVVITALVGIAALIFAYDFDIRDLGRSHAHFSWMWQMKGIPQQQVSTELVACGKDPNQANVSFAQGIDMDSICMIKKGYQFHPRGDGNYLNWCGGSRDNTVACLYYNGKIILNSQKQVVWKKTGKEVDVTRMGSPP